MNPIFDILFSITWVVLLVGAIRTMSQGWNMEPPKPSKKPFNEHPEMEEVKEGDELIVVNFGDPLHKSLSDRVDELNDPWDDEDDEDDGGDIVALRR